MAEGLEYTKGVQKKKTLFRNRKTFLIVTVLVAVAIVASVGYALVGSNASPPEKTSTKPSAKNNESKAITMLATGDWIAHDSVNTAAKQSGGGYNYLPMVQDQESLFKKADIRFCNDPILNGGAVSSVAGYPKFNSPPEFVYDMGKFGCNLVNTASNHSFDRTQAEITASVDAWAKVPNTLAVAGQNRNQAEHDTVHTFTVDGVKFGFLAYTTYINTDSPAQNSYGVTVFSRDLAAQQIAKARAAGAQAIIVSMRWGTEYSTGVDSEQVADAQWLASQGVDLVLGHGSHTLQPVTEVSGTNGKKTIVWYSLGNFLNSQIPPETLINGIAVMQYDKAGQCFTIQGYVPVYMHYEWTAAQAAAENTNARHNLHLYYFDQATQALFNSQQLKTTIAAQRERLTTTLNSRGLSIPLLKPDDVKL